MYVLFCARPQGVIGEYACFFPAKNPIWGYGAQPKCSGVLSAPNIERKCPMNDSNPDLGVGGDPYQPVFSGNPLDRMDGLRGDSAKLDLVISQVEKTEKLYPGIDYDLAVALCRLKRLDECREYASRAAQNGFPIAFIKADPDLLPISREFEIQ